MKKFILNNYRKTNVVLLLLAGIIGVMFFQGTYIISGDRDVVSLIVTILLPLYIIMLGIFCVFNFKSKFKIKFILYILIILGYALMFKMLLTPISYGVSNYELGKKLRILFDLHYLIYPLSIYNIIRKNKYNEKEKMISLSMFINVFILLFVFILVPNLNERALPFNEARISSFYFNNDMGNISYIDFIDNGFYISLLLIVLLLLIIIDNIVLPIINKKKFKLKIIQLLFIIIVVLNFVTLPPFKNKYMARTYKETTDNSSDECYLGLCYESSYKYELYHIFRLSNTNEGIYEETLKQYYIYNPFKKELIHFNKGNTTKYKVIKYDGKKLILSNGKNRIIYTITGYMHNES